MASTDRVIKVKLTTDASELIEALDTVKAITLDLLTLGVDKANIPSAVAAVTKLAEAGSLSHKDAARIAATTIKTFSLTGDGVDKLTGVLAA